MPPFANRGLGLAFPKAFLALGAKEIYVGARNFEAVDLKGVAPLKLDVNGDEDISAAARAAGDVDLIVHDAGIAKPGGFLAIDCGSARRIDPSNPYEISNFRRSASKSRADPQPGWGGRIPSWERTRSEDPVKSGENRCDEFRCSTKVWRPASASGGASPSSAPGIAGVCGA